MKNFEYCTVQFYSHPRILLKRVSKVIKDQDEALFDFVDWHSALFDYIRAGDAF